MNENNTFGTPDAPADGGAFGAQRGDGVVDAARSAVGAVPQGEPGFGRRQPSRVIPGPGPLRAHGGMQQ